MLTVELYPPLSKLPLLEPAFVHGKFSSKQNERKTQRKFLRIPARFLHASGLSARPFIYISIVNGDEIFICGSKQWKGKQRQSSTGTVTRNVVLQLSKSKVPLALHEGGVIVAGPGYVRVLPAYKSDETEQLPEIKKHKGVLNNDTLIKVNEPFPAQQGLASRRVTTATYGRAARCVDISGAIWKVAGFELESPLRVTCFNDAVLIEKSTLEQANSRLRCKTPPGRQAYSSKRIGRATLEELEGDVFHVIALADKLVLIDQRRCLSEFGLTPLTDS